MENQAVVETIKAVEGSIVSLATKLGLTAEKVLPYAIKKVWADSISGIVISGIVLIAILFISMPFLKYTDGILKESNAFDVYPDVLKAAIWIGSIFAAITALVFLCSIKQLIEVTLAPEFSGAEKLMSLLPQNQSTK
jgi:hypothetical protein